MARQRQQKEGRWAFLSGGQGADYYRWKVGGMRRARIATAEGAWLVAGQPSWP